MMNDWSELGALSPIGDGEIIADHRYPHAAYGNSCPAVGTEIDAQVTENKVITQPVPTVPAVPITFEKVKARHVTSHESDAEFNAGWMGGRRAIAPASGRAVQGCKVCAWLCRPGLSDGYCGGCRDDLPHAYGVHHPLRRLPDDEGIDCPGWTLRE
ncbi:hypothetical protein [Thauera sp. SDU_THAU2]|uniref:hypothetical protein n=1 Tax=Thauera sp. SDU_THAU2 TaxID=3136633 RepID=UPI00311EAD77